MLFFGEVKRVVENDDRDEHPHFDAEGGAVVVAEGVGGEQRETGSDDEDQAGGCVKCFV